MKVCKQTYSCGASAALPQTNLVTYLPPLLVGSYAPESDGLAIRVVKA